MRIKYDRTCQRSIKIISIEKTFALHNSAQKKHFFLEFFSKESSWWALLNHLKIENLEKWWFFTLDDTLNKTWRSDNTKRMTNTKENRAGKAAQSRLYHWLKKHLSLIWLWNSFFLSVFCLEKNNQWSPVCITRTKCARPNLPKVSRSAFTAVFYGKFKRRSGWLVCNQTHQGSIAVAPFAF